MLKNISAVDCPDIALTSIARIYTSFICLGSNCEAN
jgi:hypothetical protein